MLVTITLPSTFSFYFLISHRHLRTFRGVCTFPSFFFFVFWFFFPFSMLILLCPSFISLSPCLAPLKRRSEYMRVLKPVLLFSLLPSFLPLLFCFVLFLFCFFSCFCLFLFCLFFLLFIYFFFVLRYRKSAENIHVPKSASTLSLPSVISTWTLSIFSLSPQQIQKTFRSHKTTCNKQAIRKKGRTDTTNNTAMKRC